MDIFLAETTKCINLNLFLFDRGRSEPNRKSVRLCQKISQLGCREPQSWNLCFFSKFSMFERLQSLRMKSKPSNHPITFLDLIETNSKSYKTSWSVSFIKSYRRKTWNCRDKILIVTRKLKKLFLPEYFYLNLCIFLWAFKETSSIFYYI